MSFSLNFVLSNPNIGAIIPAASNLEQLREYLRVFHDVERLGKNEIAAITKFVEEEVNLTSDGQSSV